MTDHPIITAAFRWFEASEALTAAKGKEKLEANQAYTSAQLVLFKTVEAAGLELRKAVKEYKDQA